MLEHTLAMIKPDAVGAKQEDEIIDRIAAEGFRILCTRRDRLSREEAKVFYKVHEGKPFFESLIDLISSGPIVALLLVKEDAISELRRVIGATDPREAAAGTIRSNFATSKEKNAIHASDSIESADIEIPFFFSKLDALRAE